MITAKFSDSSLRRVMKRMESKTKNPRPFLEDVARHEIYAAQKRIRQRKVTPDGSAWKPWAPSTRKQRIKEGTAARGILYRTGLLARSFKSRVNKKYMAIWNSANYSTYLQYGTPKMPARPYLGWGRQARNYVERAIVKYLKPRSVG